MKSDPVILEPFEITLAECDGDFFRMLKKFTKKVRKHEVLKPYYNKLSYFTSKSQLRRQKKIKAIYEEKRGQENLFDE
jgi:hypothetical protein